MVQVDSSPRQPKAKIQPTEQRLSAAGRRKKTKLKQKKKYGDSPMATT
jgi:hypothetical protein